MIWLRVAACSYDASCKAVSGLTHQLFSSASSIPLLARVSAKNGSTALPKQTGELPPAGDTTAMVGSTEQSDDVPAVNRPWEALPDEGN